MSYSLIRSAAFALMRVRPIMVRDDPRLAGGILTVDAFDTLITRAVLHPTDVFTLCGIALRERRIIAMPPDTWRDLRHRTEADIAILHHPREVQLGEIYSELVLRGALTVDNHVVARDVERDIEASVSRPIAAMIALVHGFARKGGIVKVLSDTPLPSGEVWDLLRRAGLELPREAVISSSDIGKTKRSGAMFAAVKDSLAGNAEAPVHVGDRFGADVRQAYLAGLRPAPYLASRPSRYETLLRDALREPNCLGSVIAGSARATRLAGCQANHHKQTIWDTSANVTGPLLFAFVVWILREARKRGLRTIYFFSRDGEILLQIARELQPVLAEPIECRYLRVSRQSLHLPGVTSIGEAEREWIVDNSTSHDLNALLARLDISRDEFLRRLPGSSPLRRGDPRRLMTPGDAAAMSAALDLGPVRELILARATQRRTACLAYMEQQGLLLPGPIAVVDIGWRGRLQRSLCRIIETLEPDFADRLHGFYIDLGASPEKAGSLATFSALCRPNDFSWAARGPLFEAFCAARDGTVKGYRLTEDGTARAILASDTNPEAQAWGVAVQQEAITAFAREAVHGMRLARLDPLEHVEPMARAVRKAVRLFVSRPSRAEGEAYGRFGHASDEQHEMAEEMAGVIDFRPRALLQRLGPKYRWRRISHWPEGSVVRSVPSWLTEVALRALRALPGRRA